MHTNQNCRPHQFPRARTSSSVTSSVSLLLLTVPFVTTRIRLVKTVSYHPVTHLDHIPNVAKGGQIGHRKYDCPEQRNFTANIICRVCGNAGHMARDCPDRQRGSDWRNGGGFGGRGAPRALGPADAVDREMEVSFLLRCDQSRCSSLTFPSATHERTVWWCSRRAASSH